MPDTDNQKHEGAPLDFEAAFSDAHSASDTEVKSLGKLTVSSGKIVVCDPLVDFGASPLNKSVPVGSYDVSVLITHLDPWGERYALAKLQIKNTPAVRWENATEGERTPDDLAPGEIFGYPVDAGLGCFVDAESFADYNKLKDEITKDDPYGKDMYKDCIRPLLKKNASNPDGEWSMGKWLNFVIPNTDNHNIILFQSGLGDGFYPSYWGFDATGEICCLVTDFNILES